MFKAYLDDINKITIESDMETSFYLNDVPLSIALVNRQDNKYIYVSFTENDVDIFNDNIVTSQDGTNEKLQIRFYVKSDDFKEKYTYDGDDLGPDYHKHFTTFKLWAPIASSVFIVYTIKGHTFKEQLERRSKGVYEITINKDLEGALYHYLVTNNGVVIKVTDPYAYTGNANNQQSAIVNLDNLKIKEHKIENPIKNVQDAIIYELSVRDFSSDGSLGNRIAGKYEAFIERKKLNGHEIGIDYIASLGISHVQIMPILDFASVDENKCDNYNWGYDPANYNVFEGSYSLYPNNPIMRIIEVKKMIEAFHKRNIGVILDVVFNHTYYYDTSNYNQIIPYYFYLFNKDGILSNGSFCGNDIDTTMPMVHKYFKDMVMRLVNIYHIDGLRFDLMGIMDYELINDIYNKAKEVNKHFICYGEGWNMPSFLEDYRRASINNYKKVPNIAFFNDHFRDIVMGKVNGPKGYLNGNTSLAYEYFKMMQGSIDKGCYFEDNKSSINYIECHDNYTLFDSLSLQNKDLKGTFKDRIIRCGLMSIILSLGIPFIQMGMEFNRSKKLCENSYNAGDDINMIRWNDILKHQDNINALKDFIDIRKKYSCFRKTDMKDVKKNMDGKPLDNGLLQITYAYDKILVLVVNPTDSKQTVNLTDEFTIIATQDGYFKDNKIVSKLDIFAHSMVLLAK